MSDDVLQPIEYPMQRLGVSRAHVERLMASGELPYVDVASHVQSHKQTQRTGKQYRIPRFRVEDVDAFIARRRVQATQESAGPELVERPQETRRRASVRVLSMAGSERYR